MKSFMMSFLRRNRHFSLFIIVGLFALVLILVNYLFLRNRKDYYVISRPSLKQERSQPKEEVTPKPEVVQVKVEVPVPDLPKSKEAPVVPASLAKEALVVPAPAKAEQTKFAVQVSSFKSKKRADFVVSKLKKDNYPVYTVTKNLGSKGTWYRVHVGRFVTKAQANKVLKELQKEYKNSFIVQK